jgi:hypothetical protein
MYCHAQCETRDILTAVGLCMDDLFDEPRQREQAPGTRRRPGPLAEFTTGERRVLRGLDIFVLRGNIEFARFVAGEQPEVPWQERVRLAEDDCRTEAAGHYWRALGRYAALACDEKYVRRAHQGRRAWLLGDKDADFGHEQAVVLMTRAQDLVTRNANVRGPRPGDVRGTVRGNVQPDVPGSVQGNVRHDVQSDVREEAS